MLSFLRNILSNYTWALAYGKLNDDVIRGNIFSYGGLHYVKNPYKKKWFADPFFLEETAEILTLLVEEYDSDIKKGRIARITINKQTDWIEDCSIILDLPTHLSFPAIYRFDGKIYVHPENSASGVSAIYEYDGDNDCLINPVVLIDRPLTDAIIVKKDDKYYMYATEFPHSCGNSLIEYQANEFLGPYRAIKEIKYADKSARMAGAFFDFQGETLRPAQDCNHDYGEAVLLYKGETVFSELRPKGLKYEGLHTFNQYKDSFVIDLKKYDFAFIHGIVKRIMRSFK